MEQNVQKKYTAAKVIVGILLVGILGFIGYLGVMKVLEKNVLASLQSEGLQVLVTIHTEEARKEDFDLLMEKYPEHTSLLWTQTGLDYNDLWAAIYESNVKSVYILQYTQGTVMAWSTMPGAASKETLSSYIGKIAPVSEYDGMYVAKLSGGLEVRDILSTKEKPSIASLPKEFSTMNNSLLSFQTYNDWDNAAVITQAASSLPVSSLSLLLHSTASILENAAGHLVRQGNAFSVVVDVAVQGDISSHSEIFSKIPDTKPLQNIPIDASAFIVFVSDPAIFEAVQSYIKTSTSEQSAAIFINLVYGWLQDVLKTTSPQSFIADLPSSDAVAVRYADDSVGVLFDKVDQDTQGMLFEQLYSAIRLALATEEVPVTLPDNTKSTYLRLNDDLIKKETRTASGATISTLAKEDSIVATSRTMDESMLVTVGTGTILTDLPVHDRWTTMTNRFSTPMNVVAMMTVPSLGEDTSMEQVLFGIKILKERVRVEFLLQ